jgi:hypothetical protein
MLAGDPAYDLSGSPIPEYTIASYQHLERWYDRALGVPLIYRGGGFVFTDRAERKRLEAYKPGYYRWVPSRVWRSLYQ